MTYNLTLTLGTLKTDVYKSSGGTIMEAMEKFDLATVIAGFGLLEVSNGKKKVEVKCAPREYKHWKNEFKRIHKSKGLYMMLGEEFPHEK